MTIISWSWLNGISASGEHTSFVGVGGGRVEVTVSVTAGEGSSRVGCGVLLPAWVAVSVLAGEVVPTGVDPELHAVIRDMHTNSIIRPDRSFMG